AGDTTVGQRSVVMRKPCAGRSRAFYHGASLSPGCCFLKAARQFSIQALPARWERLSSTVVRCAVIAWPICGSSCDSRRKAPRTQEIEEGCAKYRHAAGGALLSARRHPGLRPAAVAQSEAVSARIATGQARLND